MRRKFTITATLKIQDEKGRIIEDKGVVEQDVWDDGGVYKTYWKCLKFAKDILFSESQKEGEVRKSVCKICSTCNRVEE